MTSLRVSVNCPLGKLRIRYPCRSSACTHLQCFDASLFLQMNEKKSTWMCPVCDKKILYNDLAIDGYFVEVLKSPVLPSDCTEIEMSIDGSWEPKYAKGEVETENWKYISREIDREREREKKRVRANPLFIKGIASFY